MDKLASKKHVLSHVCAVEWMEQVCLVGGLPIAEPRIASHVAAASQCE